MKNIKWSYADASVDWEILSELYRLAPLGEKRPADLRTVFGNSRYKCFLFDEDVIVGVGRALADGADCSYLCDVAVHPDYQGRGLGRAIILKLVELSEGHKKIVMYASPGKEGFYLKLGFRFMNTAMAIFQDAEFAIEAGILREGE